jgi:hypothetical protein
MNRASGEGCWLTLGVVLALSWTTRFECQLTHQRRDDCDDDAFVLKRAGDASVPKTKRAGVAVVVSLPMRRRLGEVVKVPLASFEPAHLQ